MINWMTHHTKRRFMAELKSMLQNHPRYVEDVQNVVNKFGYKERASRGIIINSTSAERVRLSADNYIGRQKSFVVMSPYRNSKGTSIEFVNENMPALEAINPNRNVFPTPPGFFVISIDSLPNDGTGEPGYFTLKQYLSAEDPSLLTFNDSRDFIAYLSHQNIYPGSVQIYFDDRIRLIPDVDYTVDYGTSEIRFLKDTPTGYTVSAKYRHGYGEDRKLEFHRNAYQTEIVPGVVLAFGDRATIGDQVSIRINESRVETADVYGGKFEVNLELLTYSKDASDREQLVDYVTTSILGRQMALIDSGIELMEVSPGSDAEETFNPETDEYYYEQSISVQLRVDWMIMVPLMLDNVDIEMTSAEMDRTRGHLDGTYTYDLLKAIESGQYEAYNKVFAEQVGLVRIV